MASLANADLPSDDEEDDDYNPALDNTAEKEDLPAGAGRAGTKRGAKGKRRRGAAIVDAAKAASAAAAKAGADDDDEADEEDDHGAAAAAAAVARANDPRAVAKRAKVDDLWQQLNTRAAANSGGAAVRPSAATNLASLCHSASASAKGAAAAKPADPDAIWKRALGLLPKRTGAGPSGQNGTGGAAAAAAVGRAGGAASGAPAPGSEAANGHAAQGPAGTSSEAAAASRRGAPASPPAADPAAAAAAAAAAEERRALAGAALAAAREAATVGTRSLHGKVAVTEVRRFAGRDVQVTLHVDKDSKEAAKAVGKAAAPPLPAAAASGLDAVLADLEKKKKVSVLDKTKADWTEYKTANATVEDELEAYKRSSNQYLDKQNFLKRAELREYEKERDSKLAADVRNRGRL